MKAIRSFNVRFSLPEELRPLERLAANLRWSWHEPTRQLFREISHEGWRATRHDPVQLLSWVGHDRILELAADETFVERVRVLAEDLDDYVTRARWYQSVDDAPSSIAYFSPEFGITSALPQYSGGLGILAGDHLKAASDLGVPLIGVGLFYRAGYFRQAISHEGWQQESYPLLDPQGMPLTLLRHPDGQAAKISLSLPGGRHLQAQIWIATVGRVPLLLLDTDIAENPDDLRLVADRLYGGGETHRLEQEILLGIGGVRALALYCDIQHVPVPEVFHSNEGHAGFLGIERISRLIAEGLQCAEALQVVRSGTVFTTHTPVPAGIDRFDIALVRAHFATDLVPGVPTEAILELGREPHAEVFNMARLGFALAQRANGVSRLHGDVSRGMFHELWPGFDRDEVPIASVTNGVHAPTWTSPALKQLALERLGHDDTSKADWGSEALDDETIWAVRRAMREHLIRDARARTKTRLARNEGAAPSWVETMLDPNVLTIGFARRVPTYKRLTLMLHDRDRLRAILTNPERPVQLIIAGKSHPADEHGKALIQEIVRFAEDPVVRGSIVFLENYDIAMAKTLYPGCDVWLNNPLRPLEACGTSGMKAALNGSLNLSILDGWWDECFDGANGWAIPSAGPHLDEATRDAMEANALYDLLEHEVVPKFYDRDEHGIPRTWVQWIRHTLETLSPHLSAERMLSEYVSKFYIPAYHSTRTMTADHYRAGREFAAWKQRIVEAFSDVAVQHVEFGGAPDGAVVGDSALVRAHVYLGTLAPTDVLVEVVTGAMGADGELRDTTSYELEPGPETQSVLAFAASVPLTRAGTIGCTVRVVPRHELLASAAECGLIAVPRT